MGATAKMHNGFPRDEYCYISLLTWTHCWQYQVGFELRSANRPEGINPDDGDSKATEHAILGENIYNVIAETKSW